MSADMANMKVEMPRIKENLAQPPPVLGLKEDGDDKSMSRRPLLQGILMMSPIVVQSRTTSPHLPRTVEPETVLLIGSKGPRSTIAWGMAERGAT